MTERCRLDEHEGVTEAGRAPLNSGNTAASKYAIRWPPRTKAMMLGAAPSSALAYTSSMSARVANQVRLAWTAGQCRRISASSMEWPPMRTRTATRAMLCSADRRPTNTTRINYLDALALSTERQRAFAPGKRRASAGQAPGKRRASAGQARGKRRASAGQAPGKRGASAGTEPGTACPRLFGTDRLRLDVWVEQPHRRCPDLACIQPTTASGGLASARPKGARSSNDLLRDELCWLQRMFGPDQSKTRPPDRGWPALPALLRSLQRRQSRAMPRRPHK
jgi:hypothetical protein